MRFRSIVAGTLPVVIALMIPDDGTGQILRRMGNAARSAAEGEVAARIAKLTRDAVRCVLLDARCYENAQRDGKEVIFTDDGGKIITDEDGVPITDPDKAARAAHVDPAEQTRPGEGVWANYDFVPGETVLFYEDFAADVVGDFPRRMEFVNGNWDVVEWQGRRLLRNTGPRHSALKIALPRALPERFTIEVEAYFTHTNHQIVVATAAPVRATNWSALEGHFFRLGVGQGTGVDTRQRDGRRSVNRTPEVGQGLVQVRIMVDGTYAKVYVGEKRVANIPNAEFRRTEELWLENVYSGSAESPVYIGNVRVAEGGLPLYDQLARDGRVATQGILFDVNSATLRPESTPTLVEIGSMLVDNGALRLRIEGHTDSTGEADTNLDLSRRRAAAVRDFLLTTYGIDAGRLESAGLGETMPVDDDDTPEGRQNNRRVELVRLDP